MKMGDRRHKKMDRMGVRVINKTEVTSNPKNRAERRAAFRFLKKNKNIVPLVDPAYGNDKK